MKLLQLYLKPTTFIRHNLLNIYITDKYNINLLRLTKIFCFLISGQNLFIPVLELAAIIQIKN